MLSPQSQARTWLFRSLAASGAPVFVLVHGTATGMQQATTTLNGGIVISLCSSIRAGRKEQFRLVLACECHRTGDERCLRGGVERRRRLRPGGDGLAD
jgi:hypothetical protein